MTPERYQDVLAEANALFDDGAFAKALPLLKKLRNWRPDDGHVNAYYAYALYKLKGGSPDVKLALDAARRDPRNEDLACQLEGVMLCESGRMAAGLELLRHACELRGDWKNRMVLASWLESADEEKLWSEAEEVLRSVLTDHPGDAEAETRLGAVLAMSGRLEEARSHLEAAVRDAPDDPYVHSSLGWVYQRNGSLQAAVFHARRAVELGHPDWRDLLLATAKLYHEMGDSEEARRCLTEVLHKIPDDPEAIGLLEDMGRAERDRAKHPGKGGCE